MTRLLIFHKSLNYPEEVNIKAIVIALGSLAAAQAQRVLVDASLHTADKPYVQAAGEATVSAKPDQAVIDIGVVTQATTAAIAVAQNATQTDAVITELTRVLGGNKNLKTTTYSLQPTYQTPKRGATPTITGYTARNVVEVTLDDLTQVSKVIDTGTKSGANVIQNLQYRLRNPVAVRSQALREASAQAKASAEAIASGLGLKAVRVLSAEEVSSEEGLTMAKRATPPPGSFSPSTPLEVGTIDITANVLVKIELSQ